MQGETHHFLRAAVILLLSVTIGIGQWLFQTFIYERFIEDKMGQFVDLCSIANISVFVLQERYFGFVPCTRSSLMLARYYVHGKSVHGFADTDMLEMREQLRKVESRLLHGLTQTSGRG